jgi:hypothetical protein
MAERNEAATESLFINRARGLLDGRVLTYGNRRKLLKFGEELGIGRFRANLLIAMAQHGDSRNEGRTGFGAPVERAGRGTTIWADLSAAMLIQGVLMLAAYFLWIR